jgi:hypothetical protein
VKAGTEDDVGGFAVIQTTNGTSTRTRVVTRGVGPDRDREENVGCRLQLKKAHCLLAMLASETVNIAERPMFVLRRGKHEERGHEKINEC